MQEKTIELKGINPIDFYGANNNTLKFIEQQFLKIKIIARGNELKVIGEEQEIINFEEKLNAFIRHYNKYNKLSEGDIVELMNGSGKDFEAGGDVIVYGNGGAQIVARTANQRRMVIESQKNDMLFAIGPAGTGKTYTAVALAVKALKNKEVKRIVLTRPAVEAGENLGFLPGDLKEKLDPYLQPLYDGLRDMIHFEKLQYYMEQGIIQIAPLAFMRGRTLDKAFVILDEAQNATESQLKMFLTRMGKSAKFVITGDVTQIDLPKKQTSGLIKALKLLKDINGISIVQLNENDVIRHRLVKSIIKAFESQQ